MSETFIAARQALLAKDGRGVLELLSRDSLARVERTRKAALSGDVNGLAPSEKFGALGLQRFLKPADLKRMTRPKSLNSASRTTGWDPTSSLKLVWRGCPCAAIVPAARWS